MRAQYKSIDPQYPNFGVQRGLEDLRDTNGNQIGICTLTGIGPIRAHMCNNQIISILCGNLGKCRKKCPFKGIIEFDRTDYNLSKDFNY